MNTRPDQPPEGRLIAAALERSGLSIREASRRAAISYGRWRQVVTGVQNVSPGVTAAVRAPARTVARMAAVVGVTPEQMETEGHRPDAAEAMRRNAVQPPAAPFPAEPAPSRQPPPLRVLQDPNIDEHELAREEAIVDDELARRMPPRDADEAKAWALTGVSFENRRRFVAMMRLIRRQNGTEGKRRQTGLVPA